MKNKIKLFVIIFFFVLSSDYSFAARRALLIGFSNYQYLQKLDNGSKDIEIMKKVLDNNYEVTTIDDKDGISKSAFLGAWLRFLKTVRKSDEVIIYVSAHGIDLKGANHFLPLNIKAFDNSSEYKSSLLSEIISFRSLMNELDNLEVGLQLWIIDACRENPLGDNIWSKSLTQKGGLDEELGTSNYIIYAAEYGKLAYNSFPGDTPKNGSVFTRAFAEIYNDYKNRDIDTFVRALRKRVSEILKPDKEQKPTRSGIMETQFCFDKCIDGLQNISIGTSKHPNIGIPVAEKIPTENRVSTLQEVVGKSGISTAPSGKLNGNAVFLGKKSSSNCSDDTDLDNYPLGCKILREMAGDGNKLIRYKNVKVLTDLNLRETLPVLTQNGSIKGCKVKVIRKNEMINIASVIGLTYSGDTFYWGVLEGSPLSCVIK